MQSNLSTLWPTNPFWSAKNKKSCGPLNLSQFVESLFFFSPSNHANTIYKYTYFATITLLNRLQMTVCYYHINFFFSFIINSLPFKRIVIKCTCLCVVLTLSFSLLKSYLKKKKKKKKYPSCLLSSAIWNDMTSLMNHDKVKTQKGSSTLALDFFSTYENPFSKHYEKFFLFQSIYICFDMTHLCAMSTTDCNSYFSFPLFSLTVINVI